ncbi:MAG: AbiV family abortive infection protein [Candidatus Bathyarchaeia archaeon]|jgi:AbiV family abortive infection protein
MKESERKRKFVVIPVAKLNEGIELCAGTIRQLAHDAYVLLDRTIPSVWSALVLAIFAYEELAKCAELTTKNDSAGREGEVKIDKRFFTDHVFKQNVAREIVGNAATELLPSGFDEAYFDSSYFDTKPMSVSHDLRVNCVFVSWRDDKWISRPTAMSVDNVVRFLAAIELALSDISGRSPSPFIFAVHPEFTAIRAMHIVGHQKKAYS